jgi:hypothetical protein
MYSALVNAHEPFPVVSPRCEGPPVRSVQATYGYQRMPAETIAHIIQLHTYTCESLCSIIARADPTMQGAANQRQTCQALALTARRIAAQERADSSSSCFLRPGAAMLKSKLTSHQQFKSAPEPFLPCLCQPSSFLSSPPNTKFSLVLHLLLFPSRAFLPDEPRTSPGAKLGRANRVARNHRSASLLCVPSCKAVGPLLAVTSSSATTTVKPPLCSSIKTKTKRSDFVAQCFAFFPPHLFFPSALF